MITSFSRTAKEFPRLGFDFFPKLFFPGVLLLCRASLLLGDPISHATETLMVNQVGNKNLSQPITDLFFANDLILVHLLCKDFFCCPHSYLCPDVASVLYFDLIQAIRQAPPEERVQRSIGKAIEPGYVVRTRQPSLTRPRAKEFDILLLLASISIH
ncbi:MAG TPA: hypothetical protein VMI06_11635 [Terriglobia bacterium]|nr:hypothetical protein [Terriglobia bacterium]